MVSLNSRLYWCGWTPKHARNCAVKSFSSAFSLLVPAHWWANADSVKASTRARNKFELSYPIVLATSCCKPNGKKALLPLRRHECRQINRPPSSCAQLRRTGDGATAYDGGH